MAIHSSQGFKITSQDSIDTRLVLTKVEMYAMKIAALPTNYLAICKDDGKLYIYNSANEKIQPTGRFRPIDDLISFTSAAAQAQFEAALAASASFTALETTVGDAQAGTGLIGTVQELTTDVNNLKTDVDTLKPEVQTLQEEVEGNEGLMARVQALAEQLDEAEARMDEIEERISQLTLDNIAGTVDSGEIE